MSKIDWEALRDTKRKEKKQFKIPVMKQHHSIEKKEEKRRKETTQNKQHTP